MTTIILSLIGILLIVYAYFPELRYYYMRSRLAPVGLGFNAETAWKLSNLSGQYLSKRHCVIMDRFFSKKSLIMVLAYAMLFLSCIGIACNNDSGSLKVLSLVVGSYAYALSSCMLLRYCLRRFRIAFPFTLAIALILPACLLSLLYLLV